MDSEVITIAFRRLSVAAARAMGSPWALTAAVAMIVAWAAFGPSSGYSDSWQLWANTGTTLITFVMVFVIQSSQNRDAALLHAKLDTLIHEIRDVRDESLVGAQNRPDQDVPE